MEHSKDIILFGRFALQTPLAWTLAILTTVILCFIERFTAYSSDSFQFSYPASFTDYLVKLSLYAISLVARYLIMLVVMAYSSTLFLTVVITMVFSQGLVECLKQRYPTSPKLAYHSVDPTSPACPVPLPDHRLRTNSS